MKAGLKNRIRIEHVNSQIHRTFKRLDRTTDRTVTTFNAFLQMALCIILTKQIK